MVTALRYGRWWANLYPNIFILGVISNKPTVVFYSKKIVILVISCSLCCVSLRSSGRLLDLSDLMGFSVWWTTQTNEWSSSHLPLSRFWQFSVVKTCFPLIPSHNIFVNATLCVLFWDYCLTHVMDDPLANTFFLIRICVKIFKLATWEDPIHVLTIMVDSLDYSRSRTKDIEQ